MNSTKAGSAASRGAVPVSEPSRLQCSLCRYTICAARFQRCRSAVVKALLPEAELRIISPRRRRTSRSSTGESCTKTVYAARGQPLQWCIAIRPHAPLSATAQLCRLPHQQLSTAEQQVPSGASWRGIADEQRGPGADFQPPHAPLDARMVSNAALKPHVVKVRRASAQQRSVRVRRWTSY